MFACLGTSQTKPMTTYSIQFVEENADKLCKELDLKVTKDFSRRKVKVELGAD